MNVIKFPVLNTDFKLRDPRVVNMYSSNDMNDPDDDGKLGLDSRKNMRLKKQQACYQVN